MPQTPEILFIKDRIYYQADTEECQEQNDIIICNTNMEDVFSPTIKPFDCLNENLDNCIMNPATCHNIIKFTKRGALIHSRTQILGMSVGKKTSLIPLGTEGKYNYFFTWQNYRMMQTDLKVIYSLKDVLAATVITLNTSQAASFEDYIHKRSREHEKLHTTKLRELLDDTTELVWQDYKPNYLGLGKSKKTVSEIFTYVSLITTVLTILVTLGICCWKRLKNLNSTTKIIYEELHKQKRQRQSRKRQRYVPENIIYEEPQLLEEISLQTVPPVSSIPIITSQYVPAQHTPTVGKRRRTEFVTEAIQTKEPEHKVTKMEQI